MPPLPPGAPPLEGEEAAAAAAGPGAQQQQQHQQREEELPYLAMAIQMFRQGKLPSGCQFNSTIGMYQLDGR
jgi:hypothetical protein